MKSERKFPISNHAAISEYPSKFIRDLNPGDIYLEQYTNGKAYRRMVVARKYGEETRTLVSCPDRSVHKETYETVVLTVRNLDLPEPEGKPWDNDCTTTQDLTITVPHQSWYSYTVRVVHEAPKTEPSQLTADEWVILRLLRLTTTAKAVGTREYMNAAVYVLDRMTRGCFVRATKQLNESI